jgi:hypothetical protein
MGAQHPPPKRDRRKLCNEQQTQTATTAAEAAPASTTAAAWTIDSAPKPRPSCASTTSPWSIRTKIAASASRSRTSPALSPPLVLVEGLIFSARMSAAKRFQ